MVSRYRTIHLRGAGRQDEAVAAAAITPGMLIKRNGDGEVLAHATAAGAAARSFAIEDSLRGRTTLDAYDTDDPVQYVHALPGDVVVGILQAVAADATSTVVIGDPLTSAGNGKLKKASGSDVIVAEAMEALDLNDTGDVDTQIKILVR